MASRVRQLVDPDGQLPMIELENSRSSNAWHNFGLMTEKLWVIADGETAGRCQLVTLKDEVEGKCYFGELDIHEAKRNRRIGSAVYLAAVELAHRQGLPFESKPGGHQTEWTKRIWERLITAGVAVELVPFRPMPDFQGYYSGGRYQAAPLDPILRSEDAD